MEYEILDLEGELEKENEKLNFSGNLLSSNFQKKFIISSQILTFIDDNFFNCDQPSIDLISNKDDTVYLYGYLTNFGKKIPNKFSIYCKSYNYSDNFVKVFNTPPKATGKGGSFSIQIPEKNKLGQNKWKCGPVNIESIILNRDEDNINISINIENEDFKNVIPIINIKNLSNNEVTNERPEISDTQKINLQISTELCDELEFELEIFKLESSILTPSQDIPYVEKIIRTDFTQKEIDTYISDGIAGFEPEGIHEYMYKKYDFNISSDTPKLFQSNPFEFFWRFRSACGYLIDRYNTSHVDHERDWADNLLVHPVFEGKYAEIMSISQGGEKDDYPNTIDKLQEEYGFSLDDLFQGCNSDILSEDEQKLVNLNYLKLMRGYNANRGVKLLTKISQGNLSKNQWIEELQKTFTFLKESDQEFDQEDDGYDQKEEDTTILTNVNENEDKISSLDTNSFFKHNVMLVSIGKSLTKNKKIYEAARYAWDAKKERAEQMDYVIAHQSGKIVGVFEPEKWLYADDKEFSDFPEADPKRIGFIGKVADSEILLEYLNKDIPSEYRPKGASNPVRYIELQKTAKNKLMKKKIMKNKTIKEAQVCAITFLNAKNVNEYKWISASNGSLDGEEFVIFAIFDRDTEDYYLYSDKTKIFHFLTKDHDWPLDAGLNSFNTLISSNLKISTENAEKCIFAARALIEDEAEEIDEMEFEHTFDNELGDINPEKYFSDKREVVNRIWMNISKSEEDVKVLIDFSNGLVEFDSEALDDLKICCWSKFNLS